MLWTVMAERPYAEWLSCCRGSIWCVCSSISFPGTTGRWRNEDETEPSCIRTWARGHAVGRVGGVSARALRAEATAARGPAQDACGEVRDGGMQPVPWASRWRHVCRNSCDGDLRGVPFGEDGNE